MGKQFVYFMRASQRVKIGRSCNPAKRLETLRTGCSVGLELLGTIECKSLQHAIETERRWHEELKAAGLHIRGEWFRYKTPVRAYIAGMLGNVIEQEQARKAWRKQLYKWEGKRLAAQRAVLERLGANDGHAALDREFRQVCGG